MGKIFFSFILMAILLSSCTNTQEGESGQPLVISTDIWIGASVFYYAREMGWLKEANIQMLLAHSINENMQLYASGASDLFTGTQHEYARMRKEYHDLIPIIIYDRSFGGDMVLANRTIEQIRASEGGVDVYLEADSVGEEMLEYFIEHEGISKKRMNIIHRTQDEMARLHASDQNPPTIIITYNPHDLALKAQGYFEIANSKDNRYLVVDAVYVSKKRYSENPDAYQKLSDAIRRSHEAYEQDPRKFYENVKPYLGNPSYDEFMQMQRNIEWIDTPSKEILQRLGKIRFPLNGLIQ